MNMKMILDEKGTLYDISLSCLYRLFTNYQDLDRSTFFQMSFENVSNVLTMCFTSFS